MNIDTIYNAYKQSNSVCTDTRKLEKGDIYFALKGDNFDGNTFAKKALEARANYCVIDDEKLASFSDKFIIVDDVLKTLQELAIHHRNQLNTTIIGLTGSNGKTTTKELIKAVLSQKYNVVATKGNLNNHIGVPLTLLSFPKGIDFGIVEMGANHQKEIEFLSHIVQPDYGLITNFGKAHLEGFGGVEGVIKGKSELFDYLKHNNKSIFINSNDAIQVNKTSGYKNIINFGSSQENNTIVKLKDSTPTVSLFYNNTLIKSNLIGHYNFDNISAAIAIGNHFQVPTKDIKSAIENYTPKNNRSEVVQKNKTKIILDAYNANPTSMMEALKNFKCITAKTKYLFLGDMFELGPHAEEEHQNIVDYAEEYFKTNIYLIGENFFKTKTNASTQKFTKFESLEPILSSINLENTVVLIKGSRGMALERIIKALD